MAYSNNKSDNSCSVVVSIEEIEEQTTVWDMEVEDNHNFYANGILVHNCVAGLPAYLSMRDENASIEDVMQVYDAEFLPLLEIFGKDRAFLELQFNALPQQALVNKHLIEYSKRSGYKLIAASDAHYYKPELWKEREIYKILGYQNRSSKKVDLEALIPKSVEDLKCELYPHNAEQIFAAYKKYREDPRDEEIIKDAISRTHDIAWDLVGDVRPDDRTKLPKYVPVLNGPATPFGQLKALCIKRLKEKGLHNNKEYVDRTIYELSIIKDKNIAEYFITKKGILDSLRKKMLLGTGRGSGAGSIVNYLLDITLADPVKGGLLFERFISPSRAELPDIDSDCEDKDQAHAILQEEFGHENVLAISNYNTLKLKSLVKDISKMYKIPFAEANQVTTTMEMEARDKILESVGNDQKFYELTFEKTYEFSPTFKLFIDKYPHVGTCLSTLYKTNKSIGRHAGGVIIVPDAHKYLPIIRVRDVLQSPFSEGMTAQHLKLFGLVKFDVLGLTTLKIIRRCIELILKSWGVEEPTIDDVYAFYADHLHPDVMNPADPLVFKNVYHEGRFPSIFQFSERGVQSFCQKVKPNNIGDLAVTTSLFRPGALTGQGDKKYIQNRTQGYKADHPILESILDESSNIVVFQEQFLKLANQLAGFSLDEADKLRKLLMKPSHELGQEMKQQRIDVGKRFISGCMEKGLSRERAHKLWHEEILGFISYGFNKSHAYVYAYNSYHCAHLYTYHEKEWIKACLEKDGDLESTICAVSKLGYEICKPDVNDSLADEWQIIDKKCIPPLVAIKGIGDAAAKELVSARERIGRFKDVYDFLYDKDDKGLNKFRWSKFNKRAIQNLICLEAFDSLLCVGEDALFKNARHMENIIVENFDKIKKGYTTEGRGKKAVKTNLALEDFAAENIVEDRTNIEKIEIQKELTGTFNKDLLFTSQQTELINKYNIKPWTHSIPDRPKPAYFFVTAIENRKTVNGKDFLKLDISDGISENKTINYFERGPHSIQVNKLHIAKLYYTNYFLNTEGKIHAIS